MAGGYEKVLEYGRRLVELEPNFYGVHIHVGLGLMNLKRYEEVVPEFEKDPRTKQLFEKMGMPYP